MKIEIPLQLIITDKSGQAKLPAASCAPPASSEIEPEELLVKYHPTERVVMVRIMLLIYAFAFLKTYGVLLNLHQTTIFVISNIPA